MPKEGAAGTMHKLAHTHITGVQGHHTYGTVPKPGKECGQHPVWLYLVVSDKLGTIQMAFRMLSKLGDPPALPIAVLCTMSVAPVELGQHSSAAIPYPATQLASACVPAQSHAV